ncbi:sensor histidine kinase [Micromonospora sp. NPDC049903]|uniref:sensor histidine kinase n=1 Tax=Micromonospora sp. NPDC049903 TaxID=3364276 RepID=UPI00379F06E9
MRGRKTDRNGARRRLTLRTRLTLSYAGLITGSGAVLITLVYLYMRFVPSYHIVNDHASTLPEQGSTGASQPTSGIAVATADDFLDNLLIASVLALLVMALIGGIVGWLIARRIVKPLSEIGDAARRATEGSLDHRVGLSGPPDEIQNLADTFDQMLASLERSFAAQRRFAANASHELQSPLATIKTMIDVALSGPAPDVDEFRTVIARIGEVNQSSIETVDALLDLATAEHATVLPEAVDLRAIASEIVANLRGDAARAGVEIAGPDGQAVAWGSRVLVRQAVSNLIRNAIQHNHEGGRVSITCSSTEKHASLTIINSGAVLSPADTHMLTEPFTRGTGRSLTRGRGHGLGLAIARAALEAHSRDLLLAPNAEGGLTVRVELPATSDPDRDRLAT